MTTNPKLVEFLRTFVRDEADANDRLEKELDEEGWGNYALVLNAAFFLAVDRYFDGRRDDAAIIQFVAGMRSQLDVGGSSIDPTAAEALIKSVFDPDTPLRIEPGMMGQIQTHALHKALNDKPISDDDLANLLNEAATIASSQG